jgi:hypothetical protein
MDINKLNNSASNRFKKTGEVSNGQSKADSSSKESSANTPNDKVSITNYTFRKNDQLFAKLELDKLDENSSNKLSDTKEAIAEYQKAKEISPEAAAKTEIGQKINDPSVWENIAEEMLK